MTKKIFYEKVGRRYKPVTEYDRELMDSLPKGNHLFSVYPGGQSGRYNVDPAYAPMIAAGRVAEDAISKRIMDVSAVRPRSDRKLTVEQLKAWQNLADALGNERYALEYCSYREAAEEGVKAMMAEADKLMSHPAVKKAFDNFQLVCKLVHEEQNNG